MNHRSESARMLREYFATDGAVCGLRSTFRDGFTSHGSFSREDIMDGKWHERMAAHQKVHRALVKLTNAEADVLWLWLGPTQWPLETVGAFKEFAGVALVTRAAWAGMASQGDLDVGNWLRRVIGRRQRLAIYVVLNEAKQAARMALASFEAALEAKRSTAA